MKTNATKIQCQVQYDVNGIGALPRLDLNEVQCQVLVLAPTRDLVIKSLGTYSLGTYLNVTTRVGGTAVRKDMQQLPHKFLCNAIRILVKIAENDLWKTLHKIDVKTLRDQHNEPIRGFSGKELVKHVKKHLKKHVSNMADRDINIQGSDLVKYQYIRLIASAKDDNIGNKNEESFTDNEKYLYQFENEKHRECVRYYRNVYAAYKIGSVQILFCTLTSRFVDTTKLLFHIICSIN